MSRVLDLEDHLEAPDLPDEDEWGISSAFHILDENKVPQPVAIEDITDSKIYTNDRIIGSDKIGKVKVSTVFLNLNHGFGGAPKWFETMIFEGDNDQWCWRYETYAQAEVGHKAVVEAIKNNEDMSEFDPNAEV